MALSPLVVLACLAACGSSQSRRTAAAAPTPGASASPAAIQPVPTQSPAGTLDAIFHSPSGLYTLRYNRAWRVQQIVSAAGPLDYFSLPNANLSVQASAVQPGTTLAGYVQATEQSYRQANVQGVQEMGTVDVGGGQGALLHAITYVAANGQTVAAPPSAGAPAHNFYQALYVAAGHSYSFSIAWPESDHTDYLTLFRSILRTFTPAGVS